MLYMCTFHLVITVAYKLPIDVYQLLTYSKFYDHFYGSEYPEKVCHYRPKPTN